MIVPGDYDFLQFVKFYCLAKLGVFSQALIFDYF